ncbi:MAG: TM2 domain-containing protein [Deltaproteobacteria bacterium]|nr:TM2 domain-containing protein [Deltaproteobacteria bacterium]
MNEERRTHSVLVGYLLWIFGFLGAHRFYFGRPISGTIYFFTFGLFGIGWLVDLVLVPRMARQAQNRYFDGRYDYNIAWLLLTYLGLLGAHRFYVGKWVTGLVWLCTGGVFGVGYLYDYWTMNEQVSLANQRG